MGQNFKAALSVSQGRFFLFVLAVNLLSFAVLLLAVAQTRSLVLQVYSLLNLFSLLTLATHVIVRVFSERPHERSLSYTYERCDVLCVFTSTMLVTLGSLFLIKESIEKLLEESEVKAGFWLPFAASVAFVTQLLVVYGVQNKELSTVIMASSSSWLQENVSDFSRSMCRLIPGLSQLLLPRVNPISLLAVLGWLLCMINKLFIDFYKQPLYDSFLGLLLTFMVVGTMFPLASYTGLILLQTSPTHILPQLDKCLREVGTLDGVLEVAESHFWQLSLTKMAGSVTIRVRRDADEQLVLAHVTEKLYPVVADLTIQINKDTAWKHPH